MGDESDAGSTAVRPSFPGRPAGATPYIWSHEVAGRRRAHTLSSSSNSHQRHPPSSTQLSPLCSSFSAPPWPPLIPAGGLAAHHTLSTSLAAHAEPDSAPIWQCQLKLTLGFSRSRLGLAAECRGLPSDGGKLGCAGSWPSVLKQFINESVSRIKSHSGGCKFSEYSRWKLFSVLSLYHCKESTFRLWIFAVIG